ncbi:MAG: hypothetical protein AB7I27_05700 [Bacteriovoracaceae bacterium]
MLKILFGLIGLWSFSVFGLSCDCEVKIYSPITGPNQLPINHLKTYKLEEFATYSEKNKESCRSSCLNHYQADMPIEQLNAYLVHYSKLLINEGKIGYSCTGLTTLKYPVRVRARLASKGLGNVVDMIQVVNLEESCF